MFIKNYMRCISVALILSSIANIQALTPQEGNIYQEEFKTLKEKRIPKTILDRQSSFGPKAVLAFTENAEQVGFWGLLFRLRLLFPDKFSKFSLQPVAISSAGMPLLHTYVNEVCGRIGMRVPTIFITKDKTTFFGSSTGYSASTKVLMSSGAILIGQDLLLDVSQEAVEAAIAYELCCVKHNHENKEIFMKWIVPIVASNILPASTSSGVVRKNLISFLLVRLLIAKEFEKQADRFVYEAMGNADGFVELCTYWQQKEQKVDVNYDDAYMYLKQADISIINSIIGGLSYHLFRTGHRLHKTFKLIFRSTFLGSEQNYQVRINAAQRCANIQKAKQSNVVEGRYVQ